MCKELRIEKLTEEMIDTFTKIKAETYAEDRLKVTFDDIDKPDWFDWEWYVGLGIPNREETINLIDWEYAGMHDPHIDIAMFSIYSLYNKKQIDSFIKKHKLDLLKINLIS